MHTVLLQIKFCMHISDILWNIYLFDVTFEQIPVLSIIIYHVEKLHLPSFCLLLISSRDKCTNYMQNAVTAITIVVY